MKNLTHSIVAVLAALILNSLSEASAAVVVDFESYAPGTTMDATGTTMPGWKWRLGSDAPSVQEGTMSYPAYGDHSQYLVFPASTNVNGETAEYALASAESVQPGATKATFTLSKETGGTAYFYMQLFYTGAGYINGTYGGNMLYGYLAVGADGSVHLNNGSAWSQIAFVGTVDWADGAWNNVSIGINSSGNQAVQITAAGSLTPLVDYTFNLASTPSTLIGWYIRTDATGDGGSTWHLDSVTVVPEPSTVALALGGMGVLALRRRRTTRRSVA